jgi:hypothetical protein
MRKQLLACAVLAATMIPSLAEAALISIAALEGGVPPGVPVALPGCPGTNTCQITVNTGNFTSNITGVTQPAGNTSLLLLANAITATNLGSTGSQTLDIFVTASDLTVPLANPLDVLSGLTQNLITDGWSSTLTTFLSSTNALFTGTQLASATFTDIDVDSQLDLINTGAGPYSVTAQIHIVSDGTQGQSNATVVMVPGPIVGAGLPGLIAACLGLFGLQRRRRRKQFAA